MGQKADTRLNRDFLQQVRGALNHLYDPDYLRGAPLATALGLDAGYDTPARLQRSLTGAIEALGKSAAVDAVEPARELYELLLFRYVQQFSQDEVAHQFGVSVRQLRRKQNAAIYALATLLWEEYGAAPPANSTSAAGSSPSGSGEFGVKPPQAGDDLDERADVEFDPDTDGDADEDIVPGEGGTEDENGELTWLRDDPPAVATRLEPALQTVLQLIQPLAAARGAAISVSGPDASEDRETSAELTIHPVAFQQSLLLSLTIALSAAREHRVGIDWRLTDRTAEIDITFLSTTAIRRLNADDTERVAAIRKLLNGSGATFVIEVTDIEATDIEATDIEVTPGRRVAGLRFPRNRRVTVLAVEDNAEIVAVMQRFTQATRFDVMGVYDPTIALAAVARLKPDLIVVDIMMPQGDGLLLLSRLREHPDYAKIPVIVCSVLPQAELARALGAADFVQKPFVRKTLLDALNRQTELLTKRTS